jgi:hypothetical protein
VCRGALYVLIYSVAPSHSPLCTSFPSLHCI